METVKVKSGFRTERLTLVKQVKSARWSHIAKPIPKGTEVEVTIKTEDYRDVNYVVTHPSILGIQIMVDATYFQFSSKKAEVKVGDDFWFSSVYSMNVWRDTVIKVTSRYAYFKKHPNRVGVYKIDLYDLNCQSRSSYLCIDILVEDGNARFGDRVSVSKIKSDVQQNLLNLIVKLKADKEKTIDDIAKKHTEKIKEYQLLEEQENEIKKQMS